MTDKDRAWEEVQKKAFTHWVNTVLEKRNLSKVTVLQESFSDGLTLVHFVELLCNKNLKQKWTRDPNKRILKIQNSHLCLEFLKTQGLQPKYITISSEDFVDGNLKLVLGFLWIMFRKFRIAKSMGFEDVDSATEGLLKWCREVTKGYKKVNIENFKTSFNDGNAFLAMDHAYNPESFNYDDQVDNHSPSENIQKAFELAEANLSVPQLLDTKELIDGTVDERSIILYVSLLFHAFVSRDEKNKISKEKDAVSEKFMNLEEQLRNNLKQLEKKEEETMRIKSLITEQQEKRSLLEKEKEDLISELNELKSIYEKFRELNEERLKREARGLDVLRKNILEHIHHMNICKGCLERDTDYKPEKIHLEEDKEIAKRNSVEQVKYLSGALGEENKRLEKILSEHTSTSKK